MPDEYVHLKMKRSDHNSIFQPDCDYRMLNTSKLKSTNRNDDKNGIEAQIVYTDISRILFILSDEQLKTYEHELAKLNGSYYSQGDLYAASDICGVTMWLTQNNCKKNPTSNIDPRPQDLSFSYLRNDKTIGGLTISYDIQSESLYIAVVNYPKDSNSYLDAEIDFFVPTKLATRCFIEPFNNTDEKLSTESMLQELEKTINNSNIYTIVKNIVHEQDLYKNLRNIYSFYKKGDKPIAITREDPAKPGVFNIFAPDKMLEPLIQARSSLVSRIDIATPSNKGLVPSLLKGRQAFSLLKIKDLSSFDAAKKSFDGQNGLVLCGNKLFYIHANNVKEISVTKLAEQFTGVDLLRMVPEDSPSDMEFNRVLSLLNNRSGFVLHEKNIFYVSKEEHRVIIIDKNTPKWEILYNLLNKLEYNKIDMIRKNVADINELKSAIASVQINTIASLFNNLKNNEIKLVDVSEIQQEIIPLRLKLEDDSDFAKLLKNNNIPENQLRNLTGSELKMASLLDKNIQEQLVKKGIMLGSILNDRFFKVKQSGVFTQQENNLIQELKGNQQDLLALAPEGFYTLMKDKKIGLNEIGKLRAYHTNVLIYGRENAEFIMKLIRNDTMNIKQFTALTSAHIVYLNNNVIKENILNENLTINTFLSLNRMQLEKIANSLEKPKKVPTIINVRNFIQRNKTFFEAANTNQKAFYTFFKKNNQIAALTQYSNKLKKLLDAKSIAAWRNNNFEEALKDEKVRQFLMDNKDSDLINTWKYHEKNIKKILSKPIDEAFLLDLCNEVEDELKSNKEDAYKILSMIEKLVLKKINFDGVQLQDYYQLLEALRIYTDGITGDGSTGDGGITAYKKISISTVLITVLKQKEFEAIATHLLVKLKSYKQHLEEVLTGSTWQSDESKNGARCKLTVINKAILLLGENKNPIDLCIHELGTHAGLLTGSRRGRGCIKSILDCLSKIPLIGRFFKPTGKLMLESLEKELNRKIELDTQHTPDLKHDL